MAARRVGTGAFKVGNWVAGESITLERNDTYWGEAAPLKNVVLKIMTEGTSRTMNLETGDIDLNCRLQVTDIDRVDESEDTYVLAGPQNTLRYICLNTSVEPLNNVNVRKALYHATDTELIRETIYGVKSSEKATGPVPPTFPGKNNDLPEYAYNPEKAKELLAAEGFENGFEVSFIYLANTTNNMFAEMLQAMWAEVGVTLVLQPTGKRHAFYHAQRGRLSGWHRCNRYEDVRCRRRPLFLLPQQQPRQQHRPYLAQ